MAQAQYASYNVAARRPKYEIFSVLFIVSLFVPLRINISTLSIYPSRLILILVFVPLLLEWFRRRGLKGKSTDVVMFGHAIWAALAIAVVHGTSHIEAIGIYTIEVFGCYLLGRMTVENPKQFRKICKIIVLMIALTIPIAVVESFTNKNLVTELLGPLTIGKIEHEIRLGLYRAQGVFAHPILYGIVTGSAFCLAFYVLSYGRRGLTKYAAAAIPAIGGFFSLSSAAYSLLVFQGLFIAWDKVFGRQRAKWKIMAWLALAGYVLVDLFSNRTPIKVFVSYFSLNPHTAYTRIHTWNYAIDDVMRNWAFGIGFNDWDRPGWLVGSVDNFWLVVAMRYGVIGFLFLFIAFLLVLRDATSQKVVDDRVASYRKGYCILLITTAIVIYTVHLWSEAFYFFFFFLGCRTWIGAGAAARRPRGPGARAGRKARRRRSNAEQPEPGGAADGPSEGRPAEPWPA